MKDILKYTGLVLLLAGSSMAYGGDTTGKAKDTRDLRAQVDKACAEYLAESKGVGLYICIVQEGKVYGKGYGTIDKEKTSVPDYNTVFEIGSITKVFTTEIAQQLVEQQQLSWNDNIMKYLPKQAQPATDDNTTLLHLATHTAGYPRVPQSWFPKIIPNMCDPYKALTIEDVYTTISKAEAKKAPSMDNSDYSNLGMGLLGHILEWKTGKTYEELLQQYICAPLKMTTTSTLTREKWVQATGYDMEGKKTCYWTLPVLPGAGAIKSTGEDMQKFLEANIGNGTALSKSFIATQQQVAEKKGNGVAYGWHISKPTTDTSGIESIVWHNGGTGGFRSYIGFIPGRNTGIVVLSNMIHNDFDKLAFSLLLKAGTVSLE